MKTNLIVVAGLAAFSGCLGAGPKAARLWTVGAQTQSVSVQTPADGLRAAKLASVTVLPPYNGMPLAVLRPDGTIAFDAYNKFASQPAALLAAAAFETIEASGAFVPLSRPGSACAPRLTIEITVTRFALDCRRKGERKASVAVYAALLDNRLLKAAARGEAEADASEGDYSAAFSKAFADALAAAAGKLAAVK